MLLRFLALLVIAAPSSAASAVLHPVSAGEISSYPDGSLSGPEGTYQAGDAARIFSGRSGVGADPLGASEVRAAFKFLVPSVSEGDDLNVVVRNWGSESAPGLVAGCFRISICPPLSSYYVSYGAWTED